MALPTLGGELSIIWSLGNKAFSYVLGHSFLTLGHRMFPTPLQPSINLHHPSTTWLNPPNNLSKLTIASSSLVGFSWFPPPPTFDDRRGSGEELIVITAVMIRGFFHRLHSFFHGIPREDMRSGHCKPTTTHLCSSTTLSILYRFSHLLCFFPLQFRNYTNRAGYMIDIEAKSRRHPMLCHKMPICIMHCTF